MRRNLVKQRLYNGETVIGTMIQEMRVASSAQILKAIGVVSGIHMGSLEALTGWMARGMRMIMYSSDLGFLMEAGAAGLAQLRAGVRLQPEP